MSTRVKSSDPIFSWMVKWSAGLITRCAKGQSGSTAYREARGHDAPAPAAEFGEKIMHMTLKKMSKSWAEL